MRNSSKKHKKRYGSYSKQVQIPDKVSIDKRPDEVDKKERIGDFENDLIVGKNHKGALLTMVDRYACFLIVQDVKGKKAKQVAKNTINELAPTKNGSKQ